MDADDEAHPGDERQSILNKASDNKILLVDSVSDIYLLLTLESIAIISFNPQCVHDSRIQPDHHST